MNKIWEYEYTGAILWFVAGVLWTASAVQNGGDTLSWIAAAMMYLNSAIRVRIILRDKEQLK